MTDNSVDPQRFFDAYPRFVETSRTGPWRERLNARNAVLVHANRERLAGRRVLDVASHDGRFSFAALHNGAEHVTGIEHDPELVASTRHNFSEYGVDPDRTTLLEGDIFTLLPQVGVVDVVFCFGILYHICDHMAFLTAIADCGPRTLIVDTNVSMLEGAVIQLRSPVKGSPPPPGSQLEGYPTREALEAMFSYFGWTHEFHDWDSSLPAESEHMKDYRAGRRVSVLVDCDEQAYPAQMRLEGIERVLRDQGDRRTQFITITQIAEDMGVSPQRLRVWVRRMERDPGYLDQLRTGRL